MAHRSAGMPAFGEAVFCCVFALWQRLVVLDVK